ncbi:MAG: phytoene/squalene synthase family protein [Planctomycetota bacterium]
MTSDFSDPVAPVNPIDSDAPDAPDAVAWCRAFTRKRARNFYYGLRLTPEPKRSALYAIYAFMAKCDDLADGEAALQKPVPERAADLDAFQTRFEAWAGHVDADADPAATTGPPFPDEPFWPALRWAWRTYQLDPAIARDMLDGQRQDLHAPRFATFSDLQAYCERVASTVGRACIAVWGHTPGEDAERLAVRRGLAFQLTNILRDVRDDARAGRCYLPSDELARFGVTPEQLRDGAGSPGFLDLMRFQIDRARAHYTASDGLDAQIDADCRAASAALARLYRSLLERIARDPAAVLRKRVRLGWVSKLAIAGSAARRARRARAVSSGP